MEKIFTFKDVEEKIFSNPNIKEFLPRHKSFFDTYYFAKMHPSLKDVATRSVFSLMEHLDDQDLKTISDILGYKVSISKMNIDTIKNINCNIYEIANHLGDTYNYSEICVYRKKDEVKILCWR